MYTHTAWHPRVVLWTHPIFKIVVTWSLRIFLIQTSKKVDLYWKCDANTIKGRD